MLNGDYMSLAEACGEKTREGHAFIVGEDFDPFDEHDVESVRLVGERDLYERAERLERENGELREALARLREEQS